MAIVAQTSVWLGSPIGFVVAAFISIMNFADCFPAEDSRYFELARQRASSGFAISTMTIQGQGVFYVRNSKKREIPYLLFSRVSNMGIQIRIRFPNKGQFFYIQSFAYIK